MASLRYCAKHCLSFQSHRRILTWVTVWQHSIRVKICNFLYRVTLKFDGWPWKTIGHLFYCMLCFVRHFKAIGKFKLEFQFGNAQLRSKSAIFFTCDAEIWWMTLKNNRAPLLFCFKLSASFHSHQFIQTGVTVQKCSMWVKIVDFFCPVWPSNLWITRGYRFYTTFSFAYHFKAIDEFKLEFQSRNAQFGSKSAICCPLWPWNLMDDLENQ